jgi:hypothetical protein
MVSAPVISVFELTLSPFVFEMDAVAAPSAIRVKLRPVTPLAGILNRFIPSPLKEPENEPVYEPLKDSKLPNLLLIEPLTVLYEEVKLLKSNLILLLVLSKEVNLPDALDVNVFKLPVDVCNVPITALFEPV